MSTKSYDLRFSDKGEESRRALPAERQPALLEVLEELAADPSRYLERSAPVSRSGATLIYSHPSPPLEVVYELDEGERTLHVLHVAARVVEIRKRVYVCYAHEDMEYLLELKKWLKPLERDGLVELWDDTEIRAGDEWLESIERGIAEARLAILLVSPNFLASDFIVERELPAVLEKTEREGVPILWIALSHAPFEETPIGMYQALNDPVKPLEELTESARKREWKKIYQKIEQVVKAG